MSRNGGRTSRVDVRRANVTACTRCRQRKQRCDQKLPACSNCERAGVECIGYDTITGRIAPRSYLQSLEERIAFLETKLQAHGIAVDDGSTPASADLPATIDSPNDSRRRPEGPSDYLNSVDVEEILSQASTAPLHAAAFPRYLGTASGFPLVRLLVTEIVWGTRTLTASQHGQTSDSDLMDQMFPPKALDALPALEGAVRLAHIYFEHSDSFLPLLYRQQFLDDLSAIYENPLQGAVSDKEARRYFKFFLVMAIGIVLLVKTDASQPYRVSERFLASAVEIMVEKPSMIFAGDIGHVEALTLLAQYVCLHPKSTGTWHISGLAIRLAIDLGLHEEPPASSAMSQLDLDRRRRVFWAAYSQELNLCTVLGRPAALPDEIITTEYPDQVEDTQPSPRTAPELDQQGAIGKRVALWILKERRIEAEIQVKFFQARPRGYPVPDYIAWRNDLACRLRQLYESRPRIDTPSQLAPSDIFQGFYSNAMTHLYSPNRYLTESSFEDAVILAENAIYSINTYRNAFRAGTLRFYWRTIPKLFRSGSALLYCISKVRGIKAYFGPNPLNAAIKTCSAVLWGMVERYPPGKPCRDLFDTMAERITEPQDDAPTIATTNQPAVVSPFDVVNPSMVLGTSISAAASQAIPIHSRDEPGLRATTFPWSNPSNHGGEAGNNATEFEELQSLLFTDDMQTYRNLDTSF